MKRVQVLLVTLLLIVGSLSTARGAICFRQLTGTYPVAVQRGTKATVTVYSNFTLDGAYDVLFDEPGVRMTLAEEKPIGGSHNGKSRAGNPYRFTVEVPADQPVRVYEFRIATSQGVSSIGLLRVTDFPVIEEQKSENGTVATAQKINLPATLCGVCEKKEDVDCYRFAGTAGDELVFEVFAQRVTKRVHDMIAGSAKDYLMDPILTLIGPNGQVVAQNDNFFGGDSLLTCKLPTSGDYTLEVRDCRYGGHPKYTYCVEAAKRPFVQGVFPFALQRGTTIDVEPIGTFCDGPAKVQLTVGADEPVRTKDVRFNVARGETNPVSLIVSEHPQIMAPENHHSPAMAAPISIPSEINGRLAAVDEAHYYAFDAQKNAYYVLEIESHRWGLSLDAVLEVYDATGKKLAEADDGTYTKDPQLYFQAPADGRYTICVRDLHGRGGPAFAYHLRAEHSGPDFELTGEYYYAMLAPGTRTVWFAHINRLNGFKGPVTVTVDGLPPGVSLEPVTIPPGMNDCSLLLSAAPDAKIGAALVRIVGQAEATGAAGVPRSFLRLGRVHCELQGEGGGQYFISCNTSIVGVVEKLDLTKVEATPNEITLIPGSKVEVEIRIERDKDFTDPVNLDIVFMYPGAAPKRGIQLPPGVTVGKASKLRLTEKGTTLTGKIVLEAAANALPVERLPISVLAGVNFSFSINTTYGTNPIYLTIPGSGEKPAVADANKTPAAVTSQAK